MSLTHLPVEVFEILFSFLQQRHHARLFKTGNRIVQHRVLHARRACHHQGDTDFYLNVMLLRASNIRSDELFLHHLLTLDKMPTSITSLVITPIRYQLQLANASGLVDLTPLVNMRTFAYLDKYATVALRLPASVTRVDIGTAIAQPVLDLEDLAQLETMDLSFVDRRTMVDFMDKVTWPESLSSLCICIEDASVMRYFGKLPTTLTTLIVRNHFIGNTELIVPLQCTSLTTIEMAVFNTVIRPDAQMPPSLTSIKLRGLYVSNEQYLPIGKCLAAIPAHVTKFSVEKLNGTFFLDELAYALNPLLRRLSFDDLDKLASVCQLAMTQELIDSFNDAFARFDLDHRYLGLLLSMKHTDASRQYAKLHVCGLPKKYIDVYLKNRDLAEHALIVVYGGVEDCTNLARRMAWVFEHAGARALKLCFNEPANGALGLLPLPPVVCANVETIDIHAWEGMPFGWLLPSVLPRLTSITISRCRQPNSINTLARILYDNRHKLPSLESVAYVSDEKLTEETIVMLAAMRLYEARNKPQLVFAVAPPAHVLTKYPFLVKKGEQDEYQ